MLDGMSRRPAVRASSPGIAVSLGAAVVLCGLAAVAFVVAVPPGLPYDEPAHWINVQYYARELRMPVLGEPGTSYQSQQGPTTYVLAAAVVRLVGFLGGGEIAQFYVLRAVFAAQLLVLVWLTGRIVCRGASAGAGRTAALVVLALNPMLLAIGASIQNDVLALCLAFGALNLVLAERSRGLAVPIAVGALLGLGLLTKYSVLPAVVTIPVWWALRDGVRATWRRVVVLVGIVGLATAWFWSRNVTLYGSILGNANEATAGIEFPPYRIDSLGSAVTLAQQVVAYLWVPTEYFRNVLSLPLVAQALLAAVTGAVLLFAVRRTATVGRTGPGWSAWLASPRGLLVGTAVVAVLMWLAVVFSISSIAPRIAYLALPAWLLGVASAVDGLRSTRLRHVVVWGLVVIVVGLDVTVAAVAVTSDVELLRFVRP